MKIKTIAIFLMSLGSNSYTYVAYGAGATNQSDGQQLVLMSAKYNTLERRLCPREGNS